jgi:mono/diheme cytochrome c family protein
MKKMVLIAGLLSGCVYNVPPPQFAPDHPGNPEAQSAPLPSLSRSLAAYDPAAGPDPEAPEMDHEAMGRGSMKGMDDGSMKGMDDGSMKGMDHGSMKDMDKDKMKGMDHGNMKGMDQSATQDQPGAMKGMDHGAMEQGSKMAADDSAKKSGDGSMKGMDPDTMKKMDKDKMEGMDHGSMKGMDHGAHWMAPKEAAARKNPVKADAASISRGNKLFETNCVTCHGKEGRGDGPAAAALNPKPADLKAMAGRHSDGDYAWKIANGRGAMPPWKGVLDDKQIWDVVNFVQSLGGGKKSEAPHDPSKHKH